MKTCTMCKILKPKDAFRKHTQKIDGLSSWCKPCSREKANAYSNKPEAKLKKQKYDKERYENPDIKAKIKLKASTQYSINKEQTKYNVLKWQQLNPEKTTSYKKNNKYKRREIINNSSLSAKELLVWESSQTKLCTYCSKNCESNYQIDHIEPLSTGGIHELSNLTIVCPTCNREKSNTPLLVWFIRKLNS